jgi:hemoglobin/transferrin/lactoferrin receptor protein
MTPSRIHTGLLARASCVLAALALVSGARGATLAGRLVDRDTGRPVEAASVRLLEAARVMRTDATGSFAFDGLAPGAYTLSAHHLSYADAEREVRAGNGAPDSVVVPLSPAFYRADEIVVRGTRSTTPLGATPWAADAADGERLRETPSATLSDALGRLPGVALSRDGAWQTALSIRGLGRSNVVARIDDARIETSTELSGGLSLVNPLDLERVEVMRSSGSVLSGSGSLGGAVQMVTRRAEFRDTPRAGFELVDGVTSVNRGVSHYAAGERSGPRQALRVSAGWRNAAVTRTPAGVLANSQYRDYSGTASLGLRTVGAQVLTASYQRAQAEDAGIPGGAPFTASAKATYTLARRELFGLEYAMPNLSPRVPLVTARLSRQRIARDVEVVQSPTIVVTPHGVHTTTSGQLEARLAPGAGQRLVAGAELWHRSLESRREKRLAAAHKIVGERPAPETAYMSGGAYLQDDWNAVPQHLRVVLGARYDRSRTQNDRTMNPDYEIVNGALDTTPPGQVLLWPAAVTYDQSWSANAGAHVTVTPHVALTLLLATAFRSPSPEERFQVLDLGSSLHAGNPDLRPERSVTLDAGAHLSLGRTRLQLNAFGNRLTDLVTEVPGTFEGRTNNVFVKANIGAARLYGFEVSAETRIVPAALAHVSAAYVRGEDTYHHANLPQIAPLTAQAGLDLEALAAGTLRLACSAAHTQGNPAAGETRTPGYATFGWSFASAAFGPGHGALRVRAGMDNVFDRAYRLHLSTLRGLVNLEPGRNYFLTVSLGLPGATAP